jgi:hypothetical protein
MIWSALTLTILKIHRLGLREERLKMVRRPNDFLEANKAGKPEPTTSAQRYQVKLHGQWIEVQFGIRISEVFLHYELADGTTGTARPSDWRLNQTLVDARKRRNKNIRS